MHRAYLAGAIALLLCVVPRSAEAQSASRVEVTAFGGYRFGGDFYEIASRRPVDADGAASFGIVLNIPFTRETQIEALVTHQEARFTVPGADAVDGQGFRVTVDQYQLGGLTEFGTGRARPFLTGLLGLTRYEASGDHELRFSASGGGGIKLFPTQHLGGAARGAAVRHARRRRGRRPRVQPRLLRWLDRRLVCLAGGVHCRPRRPLLKLSPVSRRSL